MNPNVLGISPNNNTASISSSSVGSATVTVKYTINEQVVTASQAITVQGCPSTLNRAQSSTLQLGPLLPGTLTGVGIIAQMQVGPGTTDWDHTSIVEHITITANSCPANFPTSVTGSTFYVGANDGGNDSVDGVPTLAMQNASYDNHTLVAPRNILADAKIASCSQTFTQTYTCGGAQLGPTYTVVYALSQGNIKSSAVSIVTVTKTP